MDFHQPSPSIYFFFSRKKNIHKIKSQTYGRVHSSKIDFSLFFVVPSPFEAIETRFIFGFFKGQTLFSQQTLLPSYTKRKKKILFVWESLSLLDLRFNNIHELQVIYHLLVVVIQEDTFKHIDRMKMNCLFCCMSERQLTRRSSSRQGIKDCIDANNTLSRFENISYKTGPSSFFF